MATKLRPELDAEIARLVPGGLGSRGFGEDAVFVRPDGFGIADGIGHWLQPIGYNSALFSRLLMHYVAEIIDDHSAADVSSDRLAVEMLQRSFDRIGIPGGSSTALIGTLHDVRSRMLLLVFAYAVLLARTRYMLRISATAG